MLIEVVGLASVTAGLFEVDGPVLVVIILVIVSSSML